MLTDVQVLAGATWVARYEDVLVWFETGPHGGGEMLTQLLQTAQGVSSGSVPSSQLGARLAAVLNAGDAASVPALVAATPEAEGLRVVVHGWGALVADGIHVPNGWVDQVVAGRRTFFLGRNTATPVAPIEGAPSDLEEGVVPGDGVSFAISPTSGLAKPPSPSATDAPEPPAPQPGAPVAAPASPWAPMDASSSPPVDAPQPAEPPAYEPPPSDPPSPSPGAPASTVAPPPPAPPWSGPVRAPAPPAPGRLVLDDGSSALLARPCVLGSAPHGSPAVQTGVALPLTVLGAGVAPVHAEIRVDEGGVAVRDLGAATTYVLRPGTPSWSPLAAGQVSPITPGTRIALGQRTIVYERP